MRLFVATPLKATPEIRALHEHLARSGDAIRPAPLEHLHLTYHFLGETDAEAAATEALEAAALPAATTVPVQGAGAFPNLREPRVFWARLLDPDGTIATLHRAIAEAIGPVGFALDRRPFRPHLTLARRRAHRPCPQAARIIQDARDARLGTVAIHDVHLIESRLGPAGAQYQTRWRRAL